MREARVLEAIAAVPLAESEDQLAERMHEAVRALDGEHGLFCLRIDRPPLPPLEHVLSSDPPGQRPGYANDLLREPLRLRAAAPSLAWRESTYGMSSWDLAGASPRHGSRRALSVVVHGGPDARSRLSMAAAQPPVPGSPDEQRLRSGLRLLACTLHVASLRLALPRQLARLAPRLTERELTCLRWVAQGKSDGVVATILGVSDSAVHFHMTNVLRKLGVATRTQAVARAMALDLLR